MCKFINKCAAFSPKHKNSTGQKLEKADEKPVNYILVAAFIVHLDVTPECFSV